MFNKAKLLILDWNKYASYINSIYFHYLLNSFILYIFCVCFLRNAEVIVPPVSANTLHILLFMHS